MMSCLTKRTSTEAVVSKIYKVLFYILHLDLLKRNSTSNNSNKNNLTTKDKPKSGKNSGSRYTQPVVEMPVLVTHYKHSISP